MYIDLMPFVAIGSAQVNADQALSSVLYPIATPFPLPIGLANIHKIIWITSSAYETKIIYVSFIFIKMNNNFIIRRAIYDNNARAFFLFGYAHSVDGDFGAGEFCGCLNF